MSKTVFIAVIIFLVVYELFLYCFFYVKTYYFNLPKIESIKSITIQKENKMITISNVHDIKNIFSILSHGEHKTRKESYYKKEFVQIEKIKIDFNCQKSSSTSIFLYKEKEEFYLEQPYNGIYKIRKDMYQDIEKYL